MSEQNIVTLKNGLRIAADEMKDVETVSIGVFVNTGSRNESPEINGISHFLEHMAFKGTKKRTARQIAEEFEEIGGRINAYTSKEKTVYYVKVLKQHAEFAVEFLSDILQNSTFDKVELEKERGVILQEIAMTNDTPDDIIFDYFQETAYPNQALGRSILGPVKNIKKFNSQHFKDYIGQQYNYSNMALVAAGAIKEKDLVKYGEKYFNSLGKSKIKLAEAGKYKGGDFRKEKKLEQINLVIGFKGFSYNDPQYYKSQILAMILGGGMSSRLFQEVRENRGL
ncbi:MAG: insulinase family protein, partial [Pelagibacterales bacterium]|nr:insulinase family protein [Pelagibacterales bacterium]